MLTIALDTYQLHNLAVELPCKTKSIGGLAFPDVRLDEYPRAGLHGTVIAHNLYGGRLITLEGTIRGSSPIEYLNNRIALQAAVGLKLDANNVPVTRALLLTDLAGNAYRVATITKSFQCEYEAPGLTWGRWQLQLQAADYLVESQSASTISMTLPLSGGVTFPVTFATGGGSTTGYITFGASSGGSATASNLGNTAVFPTIAINGPVVNPTISNDATGESLKLNMTLVAGDTVVVDTGRRTITQGGTNRMGSKAAGSTFWSLPPGNNTLRFSADSYDAGTATVTWRSAYLGI